MDPDTAISSFSAAAQSAGGLEISHGSRSRFSGAIQCHGSPGRHPLKASTAILSKGWNRYGSIAIISDIGNIGRLEDPIRYHFWMQEYRAQYIAILSGASRAVKSTIKPPFLITFWRSCLEIRNIPIQNVTLFPFK